MDGEVKEVIVSKKMRSWKEYAVCKLTINTKRLLP